MKVQTETCNRPEVPRNNVVDQDTPDKKDSGHLFLHNQGCMNEPASGSQQNVHMMVSSDSKWHSAECNRLTEGLSNGTSLENVMSHCNTNDLALRDGVPEISNELSLPEVCIAVNDEEDLSYELQQAHRIFHGFLLEKHKSITAPFLHPIGLEEPRDGGHVKRSMCFRRMEEKFVSREYETITEFVADFRLMLEDSYRHHGVDHWISKQAQKLEVMLEQKLTLLSRTLREKTSLAVTSKGRFGTEDERGTLGTSTRRRSVPRSLAAITVGGNESIMVQALRLEEQQRVKEEKRQRELDKKEAEETSAKEVEEWERSLLAQAAQWPMETMWELPAIGHFLCLAQSALNLPEIVFFELERCLLMPRCNTFLAKIMSSLLCQPLRRATLHRRPALSYRRWESELRQRVQGWYRTVGAAEGQRARAEQLGLSHQFFRAMGEVSPLEETPFHLLPFNQRVWLLKALCDNVYDTQKEVQDAVLSQPIHECRESILGYDGKENAYIHFPHFCGADLRIYCQGPSLPPEFPLPVIKVRKVEHDEMEEDSDEQKEHHLVSVETEEQDGVKGENGGSGIMQFHRWGLKEDSVSDMDDVKEPNQKMLISSPLSHLKDIAGSGSVKEEPSEVECRPRVMKEEGSASGCVKTESCEPCLSVGEHSYTGRSPARPRTTDSIVVPMRQTDVSVKVAGAPAGGRRSCPECTTNAGTKSEHRHCHCAAALITSPLSPGHPRKVDPTEGDMDGIQIKKKKRKKKKVGELRARSGRQQRPDRTRLCQAKAAKTTLQRAATTMKKKDRRKKRKMGEGKKIESKKMASKKHKPQFPVEPAFKLVCSSLEELRELISKTEDELDELESTKKRSGRCLFRKEAVKDLHITLIRLLNELSPWEPKLVKAFHRNRLRLKKDYDDFKKHPEYDNFVREEWVADDGDRSTGKEIHSFSDTTRLSSSSVNQDQTFHRLLWAGEDSNQLGMEAVGGSLVTRQETLISNEHRPSTRGLKRLQSGVDEDPSLGKRGKIGCEEVTTSPEAEMKSRFRESTPATRTGETSPVILTPTTARSFNPIPSLLAKSVGNKVTLMNRPAACVISHVGQAQSKACVSLQATKPSTQSSQQLPQPTATPKQTQTTAPIPKSPTQVVYKIPEGMSLVRKDGSPVKISVQPILDPKTGERIMQQVVILPNNLLIQKSEDKVPQQPKGVPISAPKAFTPLASSGFTIPDNRIPIQQVAPLKDARGARTPSPAVSPRQQTSLTPSFNVVQAPRPKASATQNVIPNRSLISSAVSTDPGKPPDSKQELKTICIRDSQSILVTTRGGNTGVVKVQTSDQSGTGLLPASPVITISPQFKAFLVSKTSPPAASTVPAAMSSTVAQSQPAPWSSSLTAVRQPPITATIPIGTGQTVGTTVAYALNQGHNVSSVGAASAKSDHGATAQSTMTVNSQLPVCPKSTLAVSATPVMSGAGVSQASLLQCITKPVLKRASPEERSPFTKFILVSPSSNITSASKVTSATSPSALPGSRLMFISQAPASAPSTGSIPNQTSVFGASTQPLTTAIPTEAMKMGFNLGQALGGTSVGALNKVQSITLPSGSQMRLPQQSSNLGKTVCAPALSALKSTSVSLSGPQATTSSGLVFVKSTNIVTSTSPSMKSVGPVKASGTTDGKTLTLSSLHTAHMPSTSLLTTSQLRGIPSSSVVPNTIGLPRGACSTQAVVPRPVGSVVRKDPSMTRGSIPSNPRSPVPVPTPLSPVKTTTSLTSVAHLPQPQNSHRVSSTTYAQAINTPLSAPRATQSSPVRLAANTSPVTPATTTVQQKIVINTTAPLAAGTQILLNNTRFVVPPQGLGPGSHVLIISSPAVPMAAPQGASPTTGVPRGPVVPATPALPAQVPRMAAPGVQPQQAALKSSALSIANVVPSLPFAVPGQMTAGRAPLSVSRNFSPQASHHLTAPAPVNAAMAKMVTAPLSTGGVMGTSLSYLPGGHSTTQVAGNAQNAMQQASLHTGLVNALLKPQLTSVVQPIGAVATRTQVLSTVAVPPIGSTVSRMQSLPVATVPPIGSALSVKQACPVGTVSPSNSTVMMTQPQPIRTVISSETIRMPVVLSNPPQILGKSLLQLPAQVGQTSPTTKLLVSPDGAVLNTVRGPANPGLPPMAKPLATLIVTPSSAGRVLSTLTTDNSSLPTQADRSGPVN